MASVATSPALETMAAWLLPLLLASSCCLHASAGAPNAGAELGEQPVLLGAEAQTAEEALAQLTAGLHALGLLAGVCRAAASPLPRARPPLAGTHHTAGHPCRNLACVAVPQGPCAAEPPKPQT